MEKKQYKLIGSDGKSYLSETKGEYGGHKKGKLYGKLNCPTALKWIEKGHYVENRVFFANEKDAVSAGFRPCGSCLKEKYAEWKANPEKFRQKILGKKSSEKTF